MKPYTLSEQQEAGIRVLARDLYSSAVIDLQQQMKFAIRYADLELYEPDGVLREDKFRSIMQYLTEAMLLEMEDSLK
jgi:hypothetical protein